MILYLCINKQFFKQYANTNFNNITTCPRTLDLNSNIYNLENV